MEESSPVDQVLLVQRGEREGREPEAREIANVANGKHGAIVSAASENAMQSIASGWNEIEAEPEIARKLNGTNCGGVPKSSNKRGPSSTSRPSLAPANSNRRCAKRRRNGKETHVISGSSKSNSAKRRRSSRKKPTRNSRSE